MSQPQGRIPSFPSDQRSVKACCRRFSDSFKRDAVRLVTHEGYSFQALFDYIEVFNSRVRLHSSLGYNSPLAYELMTA